MKKKDTEIEKLQKQYVKHFVLIILIIQSLFTVFFGVFDLKLSMQIFSIPLALLIYLYYFLTKFNFNFELSYQIGQYSFVIYIYLLLLFFPYEPTVYVWCILPILSTYTFKSFNETLLWIVGLFGLAISAPYVSELSGVTLTYPFPESGIELLSSRLLTVTSCISLLIFFLF